MTNEQLEKEIQMVRDQNAALLSMMMWKWQPIETAPRDGTRILLFQPKPLYPQDGTNLVLTGVWFPHPQSPSVGCFTDKADGSGDVILSTHWMSMPEPPEEK